MNGLNDVEELQVVFAAIDSFNQYRKNAHFNTTHRRRQNFYALPTAQWQMLAEPPFNFLDNLNAVDDAVDFNADLADEIVALALFIYELPQSPERDTPTSWPQTAKPNDMAKAHSTLRQFYRDWSAEGFAMEVKPLLDIVVADLGHHLQNSSDASTLPDILLPGAGLGRLLFELCLAGYNTTGNEISYHQLLASNFVLNHTQKAEQHTIYPFAMNFTNNLNRNNQLKAVKIPDIHPGTAMLHATSSGEAVGEMNMTAGDFVLSYSDRDSASTFDAVVSVYFIDTAPNLIRYVETVHNCLRPGGIWINIGPLLWHFDDRIQQKYQDDREESLTNGQEREDTGIAEPGSFELTNDEVILLLQKMGFVVEKSEVLANQGAGFGYIQDPNSMLQNTYRCGHWVARKVER